MKKILLSCLMVMLSCNTNAKENDLLSITLDKDFYFSDSDNREFETTVRNTGTGLAYVDVQVFSGSVSPRADGNDELIFDLKQKLLNYDLYPSTVLVPPHQERVIKVVRVTPFDTDEKEEFYRLRVIPISPAELLKNNSMLWNKLNAAQQAELKEELENTQGAFNFSIGAGSILTIQPRKKINFKNVMLLPTETSFSLKNTGKYTIKLSSLVLYNNRNEPVNFDKVILKPGDTKGIRYTNKKQSLKIITPTRLTYINQFGEKIDMTL